MGRASRLVALLVAGAVSVLTVQPASADVVTFDLHCGFCEGIDADASGNVYVSDPSLGQVYKVRPDGTIAATFHDGPGYSLVAPRGVSVLPSSNIAVSDSGSVFVLSPNGALVNTLPGSDTRDIAADNSGNVWSSNGLTLSRVTQDGIKTDFAGQWPGIWIGHSPADDAVYITHTNRDRIMVASTAGVLLRQITRTTNPDLVSIGDVASDEAGNLFVALPSANGGFGRIQKMTSTGASIAGFNISFPLTLAYRDGYLYATDQFGFHRIDTKRPVAQIVPRASSVRTGQTVTFDAGGSHLPFGSISRYQWDLDGDGAYELDTGTSPTASRLFVSAGRRRVSVRVTGSAGAATVASVTLDVGRSAAVVRPSEALALTGDRITFDAGGSALPDSAIAGVSWDLDGNGTFETSTGTALTAERVFDSPGIHGVSVRVERSGGVVDVGSSSVDVRLRPPAGALGVSINRGGKYTRDPDVSVSLVWPAFAGSVTISNDGGFRRARTLPLSPRIAWRLLRTGRERLPKTIYVRFDESGATTFQDDIILDETAPRVRSAVLRPRGPGKGRKTVLVIAARDNASGVRSVQIRRARARILVVKFRRRVRLNGAPRSVRVRVKDGAGNPSRWRTARLEKGRAP